MLTKSYEDLMSKLDDNDKRYFNGIKYGMESGLRIMQESFDELISSQMLPSVADMLIDVKDKMYELYMCKLLGKENYELEILANDKE